MTRRTAYLSIILLSAAFFGGFFISLFGAEAHVTVNPIPIFDGNLINNPSWTGTSTSCEQGSASGNDYVIMRRSTSTLISPAVNLLGLVTVKLNFQARTYNGTTTNSTQIDIYVSTDGGSLWTLISSTAPTSSALTSQQPVDLSSYGGQNILLRFETPNATGSKGVGLDNIAVSGFGANLAPLAQAGTDQSSTIGQLIYFDGSASTDTDGLIINYYWDFGDGLWLNNTTASHAYLATGTFAVNLTVTDDDSATGTDSLLVNIIENSTTTSTTTATTTSIVASVTTTDTGGVAINEFLVDPLTGEKEWVELFNNTTSGIDSSGWSICDNSSTTTLSGLIGTSTADKYFIIEFNSGRLNNDGDIITLYDSSGKLIDRVAYGNWDDGNTADNAPAPGKSYASARKTDGVIGGNNASDFAETITPTKGATNIVTGRPQTSSGGGSYSSSQNQTTKTETANATTTFNFSSTTKIVINEIFPNPAGSDEENEFLELKNLSGENINLTGWFIGDKVSKYRLPTDNAASTTINADGFLVIYRKQSKIAFNNSGEESAKLFFPDGTLVEEIKYVGVDTEDKSYSRDLDDDWFWTMAVTPGAANIILNENKTTSTASSTATSTETNNYPPIAISEILPNPSGADADNEFIELYNPNDEPADLNGFKLTVGSGSFTIKNRTLIEKGYLALYRAESKLALNNNGATLKLLNPLGQIISQAGYEKAPLDLAFALDQNGQYRWTNMITPGQANLFPASLNIYSVSQTSASAKKISSKIEEVSLENVREFDNGQKVRVKGIVAVEPGILGVQIFYLAGSGIQVYCYKKDFPALKTGDYAEVTGELSESGGERRIKITTASDIKILNHNQPLPMHYASTTEIDEELEGSLVKIAGQVIEVKGSDIYLDDGSEETRIYIKASTGINIKDLNIKAGDQLEVTGIVSQTKSGYRLLPRYLSDIIVKGQVKGAFEETPENSANLPFNKYLIALVIFLTALAAWLIWLQYQTRQNKS